jgi:hypothetical protein
MKQRQAPKTNRRPAATLVEVLVAIFVTAIGLLALLALFPLGAVSMAQAIKDSRCAQCAANAAALSQLLRLPGDPNVTPKFRAPPGLPPLPAGYNGPSYPVYADPVGAQLLGATTIGGQLPRVAPSYYTQPSDIQRWFTLLDDINFGPNGIPSGPLLSAGPPPQVVVGREDRYTWAYMLRQPNVTLPVVTNNVTTLSVVAYSGRSQSVLGEQALTNVSLTTGANQVSIPQGAAVRNGSWILDATVLDDTNNPDPHGYFYRVVDVQGPDSTGNLQVELQTPLKGQPNKTITHGIIVIMDNVAEVIDR